MNAKEARIFSDKCRVKVIDELLNRFQKGIKDAASGGETRAYVFIDTHLQKDIIPILENDGFAVERIKEDKNEFFIKF